MPQGKVYLVGAGPGDAELISLKGYHLICRADVILYDNLVPSELLRLAKPTAELISVAKSAGKHTFGQPHINALLVEKAKDDNVVVRLKGGDPYLFGRGGEEAEACANAGVDFEVVPGVTSATAAACYAGIPPTHRDYASHIAIVTGHRKDEKKIEIPKADTVIFLMGVSNIEKIVDSLIKKGWPKETKIAAIEHATCYNQRVITGTLGNFLQIAQKTVLRTPAVFIVGKVVQLHEKLNWFKKKPTILIPGTHPEKYRDLGTIVHRPLIKLVPLDDYTRADTLLKKLHTFDWLIFTSTNGVKFFFQRLNALGLDARALSNAKIATIGKTTAKRLKEFGIIADMVPENESSAGLLEEFGKLDMKNKKVLLPQSEIASKELPDGLLNMQAVIEKVPVYKTIDIDPGPIDFDYIDQVLFTSGSTVRAFVKRFGQVPKNIKSYCLGQPTLNEAKKHNIDAEIIRE